jgi:hypothetical protein
MKRSDEEEKDDSSEQQGFVWCHISSSFSLAVLS